MIREWNLWEQTMTFASLLVVLAHSVLTVQRRNTTRALVGQVIAASPTPPDNLWYWTAGRNQELEIMAQRTSNGNNSGATAVIPDPPAQEDTVVGDIMEVPEHPVVEPTRSAPRINVVVNFTLARQEYGADCIHIENLPPTDRITAEQAHNLLLDLGTSRDVVSNIRTQLGFDS